MAEKEPRRGTFAELAEEWFRVEVENSLKHPEAVRRALDNLLIKKLGRLPASEVRPADCARLLDEVRDKHPTTANDLLRHLKAIFAFGIRRHRVDASPVAAFVAAKDAGGGRLAADGEGTCGRFRVVVPCATTR